MMVMIFGKISFEKFWRLNIPTLLLHLTLSDENSIFTSDLLSKKMMQDVTTVFSVWWVSCDETCSQIEICILLSWKKKKMKREKNPLNLSTSLLSLSLPCDADFYWRFTPYVFCQLQVLEDGI